MSSKLYTDIIRNTTNTTSMVLANVSLTGRYKRQIYTQVDTLARSTPAATWTLGPTFEPVPDFQPGSVIRLDYFVPMRNDYTGWGGGYIEPQVRFNELSWQSLGSTGYDVVMKNGTAMIASYSNTIFIDPGQTAPFSTQFRFYYRAYDSGPLQWNQSHDINTVSGTASIMPGNNGNQHYAHIIVQELATLA
jgi:hypothetical protein